MVDRRDVLFTQSITMIAIAMIVSVLFVWMIVLASRSALRAKRRQLRDDELAGW